MDKLNIILNNMDYQIVIGMKPVFLGVFFDKNDLPGDHRLPIFTTPTASLRLAHPLFLLQLRAEDRGKSSRKTSTTEGT